MLFRSHFFSGLRDIYGLGPELHLPCQGLELRHLVGDELFDLANYSSFLKDPASRLEKVAIYKDGNTVRIKPVKGMFRKEQKIDVAFPVVHGTNVEDGSLAGFLQMLDLPYTSCDVLGGAVGQDKAVMKDIFRAEGIPMTDYFIVYNSDFEENYSEIGRAHV